MVKYSEVEKWRLCRDIAVKHGYFIVDRSIEILLYRKDAPKNKFVGKRKRIDSMIVLVKQITGVK